MRKRIDILFYMEHKNREEATIKELKKGLKGYKIKVASSLFAMGLSKCFYKPKLIITPWMYSDKDYRKIVSFPFLKTVDILNLHHEQITNANGIKALLPSGLAKEGYHISWGKYFTQKLENEEIKNSDIFETGSVRLELTKKNKYTREELKKFIPELKIENEWYLFISSFSWKDMGENQLKKLEKLGEKNAFKFKEISKISYEETLNWISKFLEENKKIEYIYRLHPSETLDEKLLEMSEKHSNFHLNKELSIGEWIHNANKIELWISTSIAEIIIAEKPFRIIRPVVLNEEMELFGFEKFDKIININQFLEINNGKENLLKGMEYINHFYNTSSPLEKTTTVIKKILSEKNKKVIKLKEKEKIFICLREVLKDILKILGVKSSFFYCKKIKRIYKDYFIFN